MPAPMNTDACDRPRAITTMGRRGCVVPGQTWVSRQRAFAGIKRNATVVYNACNGHAFHVVRRLYREYRFIGSTSSTRTAGTRSCRWLPRASVPPTLPRPAPPFRPMCVQACACVRGWMQACACLCVYAMRRLMRQVLDVDGRVVRDLGDARAPHRAAAAAHRNPVPQSPL
jgi:hypothetical protein